MDGSDTAAAPLPILRIAKVATKVDLVGAYLKASRQPGQSGWRMFRRIIDCRFGVQRLSPEEFFRFGLHRASISDAVCATFLSDDAVTRFNSLLNGDPETNDSARLNDKLGTAEALRAAGLPIAPTKAIFQAAVEGSAGVTLHSARDIERFLLTPGSTPCFGKPVHGSFSIGVVAVEATSGQGMVRLGNGQLVAAADLAAEIAINFPEGYMFQDLLRASAAIRPLSGPVVPTLRVYTLRIGSQPVPLYAALRLPAPGAMADDGGIGRNARLHVDVATGAILRGQDMTRFGGSHLDASPVTGLPLVGQMLSDWPMILDLAKAAHRQFPRHVSAGSDIALSDRGPVLNEVNSNPHHMTYQVVSGRGILNDHFRPLFRAALREAGVSRPVRGTAWPFE